MYKAQAGAAVDASWKHMQHLYVLLHEGDTSKPSIRELPDTGCMRSRPRGFWISEWLTPALLSMGIQETLETIIQRQCLCHKTWQARKRCIVVHALTSTCEYEILLWLLKYYYDFPLTTCSKLLKLLQRCSSCSYDNLHNSCMRISLRPLPHVTITFVALVPASPPAACLQSHLLKAARLLTWPGSGEECIASDSRSAPQHQPSHHNHRLPRRHPKR